MNRAQFRRLSTMRLREAKALFAARLYSGSYYLAGYSVECALKACICKNMRRGAFPPDRKTLENIYTHDLGKLISGAQLRVELEAREAASSTFQVNWRIVRSWSESARYTFRTTDAAEALLRAIEDPQDGVLPWLQTYW